MNQSTNWDIPSSPEPPKIEGTNGSVSWKPPVNNGTELWEVNLRNGGQPPQKPVWGHTPANNIGGTWGENDESETSNVWAGGNSSQQHWSSNGNTNSTVWNGNKRYCFFFYEKCTSNLFYVKVLKKKMTGVHTIIITIVIMSLEFLILGKWEQILEKYVQEIVVLLIQKL